MTIDSKGPTCKTQGILGFSLYPPSYLTRGGGALIEFGLLGEIEARWNGEPMELGHKRQRSVLVVLLAEPNQVMSADQLIDRVWARQPPRGARGTLYGYLYRLRQALAEASDVDIVRRSGGYALSVDLKAVDLHRFRDLIGRANEADGECALTLFDEVLGLWRGEAFAGIDLPFVNALRDTVNKERLAAQLDRNDLALRLGQHAVALPALAAMAAENPLNERVACQLVLALYRDGRAAEALEHYEQIRRRLADEFGADPGSALRELYHRLLTADPALSAPVVPGRPGTPPRQLPSPPGSFVGRARELAELDGFLATRGDTDIVATIDGSGGIGKSWLTLHWAHRNLDQFPDGQLYWDLRGFDPAAGPVPPTVVLCGFIEALGIDPETIPTGTDAQAGLFRSVTARRRMLIILDNARDSAHVLPLLPGSPSCTVVVTSRNQLTSLAASHNARRLTVKALNTAEATELLTRKLGRERVISQPEAVAELLGHCAGLPLALGIVAARACTNPGFPLAVLADELHDVSTRLDALDTGEPTSSVRAVFSASYQALRPDVARVFRLLGLVSSPDISLAAVASLAGQPKAGTHIAMRGLEAAHLVQQPVPGRYRMHDLVRLYSAEHAQCDEPADSRTAAVRRLCLFYLQTAYAADRLVYPQRPPITLSSAETGGVPHSIVDRASAMTWFEQEFPCLLAVQHLASEQGWDTLVWQLAWVLHSFFWRSGDWHDCVTAWSLGVAAADRLGAPDVQALARRNLGEACAHVGDHDGALKNLEHALELAESSDDRAALVLTHRSLSVAWEQQGDDKRALRHAEDMLRLCEDIGDHLGTADALHGIGWLQARLGQHRRATATCEQALALVKQHDRREAEAAVLDSLGYIAHHSGQRAMALKHFHQALALCRDLGNTHIEAEVQVHLGETLRADGEHGQARQAWQRALQLYEEQHRVAKAESLRQELAAVPPSAP
ncbi:BTAD domain-containing putative transcriptional regulator [Amycolatopsis sp. lyj-90]|uniref:AfsR/SARP family transcriptional regulator n=1 Tax=Amycolatopsis sp. lyj-90 TaxID=2789285 RepID=UPI003979446F